MAGGYSVAMFQWTRAGTEDRWHGSGRPGGYEWWGFEALDADRRLAFSLRIAAGDPMDPEYVACMARASGSRSALAQEHILVRAVLYRDGRRVMARSFRPDPDTFRASSTSGAVQAGGISVVVEETAGGRTYRVELEPGTVLEFAGPPGRAPAVGTPAGPVWDLSWLNLAVRGRIRLGQGKAAETVTFSGRGVHDHGYGPVSPLSKVRSWAWGWGHAWEYGIAWRQVHLVSGEVDTLLLVDREGEPLLAETARSRPFRRRYSLLGIPYRRQWRLDTPSGAGLAVERQATLGSSPVGMRLLTNLRLSVRDPETRLRLVDGIGMSSVARPQRARLRSLRWLVRARETWTTRSAGGQPPSTG
ncbi:MAG: hypothetical protein O7D35_04355 [Acidobacteria bacterium]|nr:hypothetical protein [Acidobacteriota bacterium]MCZ6649878.1 hypothetical protein [Acidobacteriota bacterium]